MTVSTPGARKVDKWTCPPAFYIPINARTYFLSYFPWSGTYRALFLCVGFSTPGGHVHVVHPAERPVMTPPTKIKPIETRYAGCRFRSRLEARWAVFFDALGIKWEYEPQGYVTAAGPYLPDFRLWQDGLADPLWIEVRPTSSGRSIAAFNAFVMDDETGEILNRGAMVGDIPKPDKIDNMPCEDEPGTVYVPWDCAYSWCACASGRHFDVQFEARGHRIRCECNRDVWGDWGHSARHPKLIAAYQAARSARFEHGETP